MEKYNRLLGVQHGDYYLVQITSFGEFESPQEERILFTSYDKNELIALCLKNNWHCQEAGNRASHGWDDYYISQNV